MSYFTIRNSDGDTYVEKISKDELEKELNEEFGEDGSNFFESLPESRLRLVTELVGNNIHSDLVFEQPGRLEHAPPEQISDRGFAHQFGKTGGED